MGAGGAGTPLEVKAVDTNVVVRLLTADHPEQTGTARELLLAGIFISHGVLMETEWVLRSSYRWSRSAIAAGVADLLDLEGVRVLHDDAVLWALDRYRLGADWADMLHLLAARGTQSFLRFDRTLQRDAGAESPVTIELLP